MLVDRGADHDDHVLCGGHDTGIRGRDQAVSHDALEDLVGSRLGERHDTALHLVHGSAVQVEECDVQATVGEGQAQGQPDVATAPDDDHVPLESHSRPFRSRRALNGASYCRFGPENHMLEDARTPVRGVARWHRCRSPGFVSAGRRLLPPSPSGMTASLRVPSCGTPPNARAAR